MSGARLFVIGRDDLGRTLFMRQEGARFSLTRKGAAGESDNTIALGAADIALIAEVVKAAGQ